MYFIVVKLVSKSETVNELREQLNNLKSATEANEREGCLSYKICEESPGIFITRELFRTKQDADFHAEQPYLNAFREVRAHLTQSMVKSAFEIDIDSNDETRTSSIDIRPNSCIQEIQSIPVEINTISFSAGVTSEQMLAIPGHVTQVLIKGLESLDDEMRNHRLISYDSNPIYDKALSRSNSFFGSPNLTQEAVVVVKKNTSSRSDYLGNCCYS